MAWLNLNDWQSAIQRKKQRQRLSVVIALMLFNGVCALFVNLPVYLQFFAQNLGEVETKVAQWHRAEEDQKAAALRQFDQAVQAQHQIALLKQLIKFGRDELSGLNLKQARWTSSQLSLSGTYVNTAQLTRLSESLRHGGEQSVQLQLQKHHHAQVDIFKH
ncbi:hypothetical protein BFR57_11015 [Idiomarina sp. MD25a]|uniref:hypothetical protein n=1 Tax=Idiomarina sp. MD25a TaxID=1889913 RepID=UPI0008F875B1|nr:hypothetical protein [Idiomarina sp. MD25a]OIN03209.1 hypothetical protein BFR57_11015 [Idiomarina sp. MD25a]